MTSANALEQQRSRRHAVYGMQGVRGSNPLSSTTTHLQVTPRRAVCQQITHCDLMNALSAGSFEGFGGFAKGDSWRSRM